MWSGDLTGEIRTCYKKFVGKKKKNYVFHDKRADPSSNRYTHVKRKRKARALQKSGVS